MRWFVTKQHDMGRWFLVLVMALAVIDCHAVGQCELAKLLASDGAASDFFGNSVSITGTPGNEVAIVGAYEGDGITTDSGSAYIYRFNGVSWVEEQKLIASDGAANDQFGFSVSITGTTGNEVAIVGADRDDDNGSGSGSAYIYRFNGVSWVEEAKLLASDGVQGDSFGFSVSITGSPGNEVVIVGAFGDNGGTGSAYIYRFNGVTWVDEQKLLASDGVPADLFGWFITISGPPGNEVTIIGAIFDDDNGTNSGSAYIYRFNGVSWVEESKLVASDGAPEDRFGNSVSISGAPGNEIAIVGAVLDDDNGGDSGSTYIYRFNGVSWVEEQKLIASDGAANDQFGFSVSITGAPGNEVAIVGAEFGDGLVADSGSAYIYGFNGTSWAEVDELVAFDGAGFDQFGHSVSISGDIALVGALSDDDNAINSGSAYVYVGLSDCNVNGVRDCQDISAGTSSDLNGNALPDECEAFAFNLTQGTVHATIPDAIAAAVDGDQLRATALAFQVVEDIDFSSKALTLESSGDITVQPGEQFTLADNAALESAPGSAMSIGGDLLVPVGAQANLVGSAIDIETTGTMTLSASSILVIPPTSAFQSQGRIDFFAATLSSPIGFINAATGIISGFGVLSAPMTNNGNAIFIADTQVIGDYTNNDTTTIQNGTLTIIGSLVNNGTIIGDVAPAAAKAAGANTAGPSTGLFVNGNYSTSASASLLVPSAAHFVRVGGDYNIAINDNNRFDMLLAELRLVGLGAATQFLELMSEDIGDNSDGLDRSFPGHYPIGTLRIGPTPTTVSLVDNHDNDNLGQTQCEAIYVRDLIIDAGATLNTNGCPVYYETLQLDGVVDDPLNLIALPLCLADVNNDNSVNVTDLLSLLAAWGSCGAPCPPDINTDGNVNVTDLLALLAAWGACP